MQNHLEGSSLFQLINRKKFDELALKWQIDKNVRQFSTWEMTQSLICCFVMRLGSYREVESTLKIPDSTFGDALRLRNFNFFQDLCDLILLEIRDQSKKRKLKRAIREILAIDSSEIDVHGSLFSKPGWQKKHSNQAHLASAKLHVIWNVDNDWIDDFIITGGRRNDSPVSLELKLSSNKMYVFDRAYNDFDFWQKIVNLKSHFVTRLKDYPRVHMAELKLMINEKNKTKEGVIYDGIYKSSKKSKLKLRHVVYRDSLTKKLFHFVTSDFKIAAQTVADIYKRRWAVELLFRWLKGHLNIRRLPTKTVNAIKVQLAVAVMVQLLLQLKKTIDGYQGSLWQLLRQIRSMYIAKSLAGKDPPDGCRWRSIAEKAFMC
jgi:putative transposase